MLVKILYIFQHFLTIILKTKKFYKIFAFFSFILFVIIYITKVDSYDIPGYADAMRYPNIFEPGYAWLTSFIFQFTPDKRFALLIVQIILGLVLVAPLLILIRQKQFFFFGATLLIMTLAFTLGVNNAIRQAFGAVFIIFSLLSIMRNKYFFCLLFGILGYLFHESTIAFWGITILIYYFSKIVFIAKPNILKQTKFTYPLLITSLFMIAFMIFLALQIAFSFGFYSGYANRNMIEGVRSDSLVKIVFIGAVFLVSEILYGKLGRDLSEFNILRILRTFFLFFLALLSSNPGYNEIFARIMYFYFIIEAYLIVCSIEKLKWLPIIALLCSYGIATNGLNIISGNA